MTRRGFTIVELVITITIMGILLSLAVVNLTASQVNSRDTERRSDVESIALNLEGYYTNENTSVYGSGGSYPGTDYMTDETIRSQLIDIDPKSLRAPEVADSDPISLAIATNTDTSPTGVLPQPSLENDIYVYQPLTVDNELCTDPEVSECRRFNIFYLNEKDDTVEKITSKHQ